jgi:RNA polymerase sigma-70 factor (ECF subfamily)
MDNRLQLLIAGCLRGETAPQRRMFEQYQSMLFAVCLRYARDRPEAQDMLQEAFLKIFRDVGQYKGEGAFEGWLQRVTVRTALQYIRRRNPIRFAENYDDLPPESRNFHPDSGLSGEALLHMVQQLPVGYRTVFNLHCIEAFSYPEIAAELGITESTVRSQYARACKHLRSMVEHLLTTAL